ncbi:MAG: CheY-like receiver, partial [Comamonadaceae bacterium]
TRAIKREFPDANIIMVTSQGQEKMVLDSLKAGAKGYVLKPFQQQRLVAVIEKACHSVILESRLRAKLEQRETPKPAATAQTAPDQVTPNTPEMPTQPTAEVPAEPAEPAIDVPPENTPE